MTTIMIEIPIWIRSEQAQSAHWAASMTRHTRQKKAIRTIISPLSISTPCSINLIRYAPHLMDSHDNLPYAFKWIVDTIAAKLIPGLAPGRADSSEKLTWRYNQIKSKEKKIEIVFEF